MQTQAESFPSTPTQQDLLHCLYLIMPAAKTCQRIVGKYFRPTVQWGHQGFRRNATVSRKTISR